MAAAVPSPGHRLLLAAAGELVAGRPEIAARLTAAATELPDDAAAARHLADVLAAAAAFDHNAPRPGGAPWWAGPAGGTTTERAEIAAAVVLVAFRLPPPAAPAPFALRVRESLRRAEEIAAGAPTPAQALAAVLAASEGRAEQCS